MPIGEYNPSPGFPSYRFLRTDGCFKSQNSFCTTKKYLHKHISTSATARFRINIFVFDFISFLAAITQMTRQLPQMPTINMMVYTVNRMPMNHEFMMKVCSTAHLSKIHFFNSSAIVYFVCFFFQEVIFNQFKKYNTIFSSSIC